MAGHPRVRGFTKEDNKRRYALHRVLRKEGYKIVSKSRTIYISVGASLVENASAIELVRYFGYAIQTSAFE
ncbi:hypothetical protein CMU19_07130 [Elizabethkingia anophelis]|nr:hypothetical protein [Elizabethkingia anophelis]